MLIEQLGGHRGRLKGKTVLITGAGGGIGLEAARAFAVMGANVVIAEIDQKKETNAVRALTGQCPEAKVEFYETDLSDEGQVRALYAHILQVYGFADVLFHNAATISIGNVEEVPLETWEKSYRVNLKAPLLLTQLFLPQMKARNEGTVVFVSSSGAAPYMGAYEVFKTAQAELSSTLAAELEDTGVCTYTIGPGLVKTETAMKGIEQVAKRMGIGTEEFYAMNGSHILDPEEAGLGFALSVLSAQRYNGQEIGSIQVLLDAGLINAAKPKMVGIVSARRLELIREMITVYFGQYEGWMERNIFERQWVLRDFKKTVGMPAERFKSDLERLSGLLESGDESSILEYAGHFEKLGQYFQRQHKLLQGFEKNPDKLKENSAILTSWIETLEEITAAD